MKRKFISAVLFGALIASSTSTFVSCKDYDDDIEGLRTEIASNASTLGELVTWRQNEVNSQLASLQQAKTDLENQLAQAKTDLAAAIETVKNTADGNKADLVKANAEIENLKNEIAQLSTALENVTNSYNQLSGALEDVKAQLNGVDSKVATQGEQINALLDADSKLNQAIATANAEIENAKKAAADAASAAAAAQNTADKNAQAIETIAGNLEKTNTTLTSVSNDVKLLTDGLNELKAAAATKAEVEGQIAAVNELIAANANLITALQGKDTELAADILKNTEELTKLAGELATLQTTVAENLNVAKTYADTKCNELKAELGGEISTIKADLAAALLRIGEAENSIKALQAFVEEQKKTNTDVSSEIEALRGKIEEVNNSSESAINGVKTEIGALTLSLDELKGRVSNVELKITSLEETIANNKTTTDEIIEKNRKNAEEGLAALKTEMQSWTTEQIAAAVNNLTGKYDQALLEVNGALSTLETTVGNLASRLSTLEGLNIDGRLQGLEDAIDLLTGDTGTIEKLTDLADGLRTDLNTLTGRVNKVDAQLDALLAVLNEFMSGISTAVEEEETDLTKAFRELLNKLQSTSETSANYLSSLIVSGDGRLKSLVFSPDTYYQGIEAIGVYSFNYKPITLKNETANLSVDQTNDMVDKYATNWKYVVPEVMASYYLNPSNANVYLGEEKGADKLGRYEFVMNTASYTRAAKESDITINSVKKNTDRKGLVDVFFSMTNAPKISDITNSGKVDVVALRYKDYSGDKDTTITSDFAALKYYTVTNFVINKASAEGKTEETNHNHLATTAAGAIDVSKGLPRFQIAYTNEDGIDLDKWINVHYDYADSKDQNWGGQATINKKNFSLKYELIGYQSPNYQTNESEHARIEADGHTLKIQGYNGQEQGRQIIGRTPLVRVVLVDNNNGGQKVAVGYFVVEITDENVDPKWVEADAVTNAYTVGCNDGNKPGLDGVQVITWDEIENQLLTQIDMSKQEFENTYVFDAQNQYTFDTNTKVAKKLAKNIGTVTSTTDAQGGHQTNVLKWTIPNQVAYDAFKDGKKTPVSVWVKFAPKAEAGKRSDIYIKITWAPTVTNVTPAAEVLDNETHKARAAWYKTASLNERGWAETHMEVQNGTVAGTSCVYDFQTSLTFNKQPIDIVKDGLGTTYSALATSSAMKVEYLFAPYSDQTTKYYTGHGNVSVTNGGENIMIGQTLLANIDPTTGKIDLADNNTVKEILNAYDDELEKTLTFTVMLKATTCEPATNLIDFKNNEFDVRVIRPISVEEATVANDIILASGATHTQKLSVSFVDFHGFDPQEFWDNRGAGATKTFWNFYGVASIKQTGKATTNYSGSWKDVDENVFKITYTEPKSGGILLSNMGEVTFTPVNTQGNHRFTVRIPMKVTYAWGELPFTVQFDILPFAGSESEAKKH